jgi:hypothetical protein
VAAAPVMPPPAPAGRADDGAGGRPEDLAAHPPRRPATGYLTVLTRPYSRVSMDGRPLGTTPILRREVAAGRHSLRLEAEGLPVKRVQVEVTPGRLTQVNQSLATIAPP